MAKTHLQPGMSNIIAIHANGKEFALSADERRIITFLAAGYTNVDIARQFSVDASTISRRTARILEKLGVANKLELILFAIHYGIVTRLKERQAYG